MSVTLATFVNARIFEFRFFLVNRQSPQDAPGMTFISRQCLLILDWSISSIHLLLWIFFPWLMERFYMFWRGRITSREEIDRMRSILHLCINETNYLRIRLRSSIFVWVMIESTALIFVSTMAIYQHISAECVLCVFLASQLLFLHVSLYLATYHAPWVLGNQQAFAIPAGILVLPLCFVQSSGLSVAPR